MNYFVTSLALFSSNNVKRNDHMSFQIKNYEVEAEGETAGPDRLQETDPRVLWRSRLERARPGLLRGVLSERVILCPVAWPERGGFLSGEVCTVSGMVVLAAAYKAHPPRNSQMQISPQK